MKRIFIFLPPLRGVSGGLAVLGDTARDLRALGREVVLVLREAGATPLALPAGLPVVTLSRAGLAADDTYLVPEGWPNALAPGLAAGARCVVYCQNWAYLFHGLPGGVGWDRLPVSFLAVSDPVARYIELALGTRPPVLRPAIDPARFFPPPAKPAPGPVRVGFMPRKNKALAAMVRDVVTARSSRTGLALDWIAIDGLSPDGVAEALRSCHVFLATGFPEGCPLPPLEALACGCIVAGFAGFGGFDYMRQAGEGGYAPSVALRDVPWGGNGFYAADNDVFGAAACLEAAARLWVSGGAGLTAVLENGRLTAAAYAPANRLGAVTKLLANALR
ncbi:MAG: glycosyltransferase family 1 protein [Solidesulfovibrio sp.]|uniref:glycosyltransferase family 1 protein n=1 Tax=Solidesulfovibrio sp. TaxID=2910990 RepID=UPI002B1F9E00|nr:glycosyltransferase family 1 protein [Solidesulfovibrio sp.]MEA4855829.1 glycosyltransferase family 1 protein [Solidesulfovibrio sp.]